MWCTKNDVLYGSELGNEAEVLMLFHLLRPVMSILGFSVCKWQLEPDPQCILSYMVLHTALMPRVVRHALATVGQEPEPLRSKHSLGAHKA
eukprot:3404444-Amphidinium_carterae.1